MIIIKTDANDDDDLEGPKCASPTYIQLRWLMYQLMNSKVFYSIDSTLTVELKPLLAFHRVTCGNEG